MKSQFVKRDLYDRRSYIDKETFRSFLDTLAKIGFNKQIIILPKRGGKRTDTSIPESSKELSLQDFLALDQDFDGVIVRLHNESAEEEITILFSNNTNKEIYFTNNVFPHIKSEIDSNLYISTPDPVRTYGLITFIKDFLKNQVRNRGLRYFFIGLNLFAVLSGLAVALIDFLNNKNLSLIIGLGIPGILFILTLLFYPLHGLRISSAKKTTAYPPYIEKVRENWLLVFITALLTVLGTLFVQYIDIWSH